MRRSPELKGITHQLASYVHDSVRSGLELPKEGEEVELGDGLYLRRTKPSVLEGRVGNQTYTFWLVYENRAQVPANLLWALANFAMIKS